MLQGKSEKVQRWKRGKAVRLNKKKLREREINLKREKL